MTEQMDTTKQNPGMTFEAFILSLGTASMVALGELENPMTKKREKDVNAAKQHIDILEILLEKTKNNLTENEAKLLNEMIYTLRIKYVELTK
jgi:hypothetical protein